MQSHLLIKIGSNNTVVNYIESGKSIHTHNYDYGYIMGEDRHRFLGGVLYMLELVNSLNYIPNQFILEIDMSMTEDNIMRHKTDWYRHVLSYYNYTQFIKATKESPRVIINSNERYKKRNSLNLKV